MHLKQLEEDISHDKTNIVEIEDIKNAVLSHFEIEGNDEHLTVLMRVAVRDDIIDDATKPILEGDENTIWFKNYKLVFM